MFYQDSSKFTIEAHQKHCTNIVSSQLALGRQRRFISGCYLAPDDASNIDRVVTAIGHHPCGAEMMVAVDFNMNLTALEGNVHEKGITTAMVASGKEDTYVHFTPHHKYWAWYGRTWRTTWRGWEVRYQTDYILGTNQRLIHNVSVWDPSYSTYHYMILRCLRSTTLR